MYLQRKDKKGPGEEKEKVRMLVSKHRERKSQPTEQAVSNFEEQDQAQAQIHRQ